MSFFFLFLLQMSYTNSFFFKWKIKVKSISLLLQEYLSSCFFCRLQFSGLGQPAQTVPPSTSFCPLDTRTVGTYTVSLRHHSGILKSKLLNLEKNMEIENTAMKRCGIFQEKKTKKCWKAETQWEKHFFWCPILSKTFVRESISGGKQYRKVRISTALC